MHAELNSNNGSTTTLSTKLSSLLPKKRASNRTKFSAHYQDIVDAIDRGVSLKDIRNALAEDGLTLSSATFNRLLKEEAAHRQAQSAKDQSSHVLMEGIQ